MELGFGPAHFHTQSSRDFQERPNSWKQKLIARASSGLWCLFCGEYVETTGGLCVFCVVAALTIFEWWLRVENDMACT